MLNALPQKTTLQWNCINISVVAIFTTKQLRTTAPHSWRHTPQCFTTSKQSAITPAHQLASPYLPLTLAHLRQWFQCPTVPPNHAPIQKRTMPSAMHALHWISMLTSNLPQNNCFVVIYSPFKILSPTLILTVTLLP